MTKKQEKYIKDWAAKFRSKNQDILERALYGGKISDSDSLICVGEIRENLIICELIAESKFKEAYKFIWECEAEPPLPDKIYEIFSNTFNN